MASLLCKMFYVFLFYVVLLYSVTIMFAFLNVQNSLYPAGIYLFKFNNGNTITLCEICSKFTHYSGYSVVDFAGWVLLIGWYFLYKCCLITFSQPWSALDPKKIIGSLVIVKGRHSSYLKLSFLLSHINSISMKRAKEKKKKRKKPTNSAP